MRSPKSWWLMGKQTNQAAVTWPSQPAASRFFPFKGPNQLRIVMTLRFGPTQETAQKPAQPNCFAHGLHTITTSDFICASVVTRFLLSPAPHFNGSRSKTHDSRHMVDQNSDLISAGLSQCPETCIRLSGVQQHSMYCIAKLYRNFTRASQQRC